jgi:hypothetical protein
MNIVKVLAIIEEIVNFILIHIKMLLNLESILSNNYFSCFLSLNNENINNIFFIIIYMQK